MRDTFCSHCGTRYSPPLSYPRTCAGCGVTVWDNPIPVCVALVPVRLAERKGLLVIRRAIEPGRGKLALVGGFLEAHEAWAVGAAREVREETGVVVDPARLRPRGFVSTAPNPNRVLLFCVAEPVEASAFPELVASPETAERGLVFGPEGLAEAFAFPLHVEAAVGVLREWGLEGHHRYQRI